MITFIIPTIGRSTLERSINSLKNQTNPNWKCIVIYDGVEQTNQWGDERVKSIKINKTGITKDGHGQSGLVRNYGLELCDTEWVGFLDDDDTINENYVEVLLKNYSNYDFVLWRMKYTNGMILPPLNSNDMKFGHVGISFCFKNSLIKEHDLFFEENRDGEDYSFLKKLENITNNFIITPEVFYNVRN